MLSILGFAIGYLLGAVPSAYLLSKLKNQNVFEVGSGNMGTMNVARNLGFALGIVVLLLDLGKGALASYLGLQLGDSLLPAYAASFGAVLGHCYSAYVGFRGGKGLATAVGAALPLYPVGALAATLLLIILTLSLRSRSNLAAVIIILLYPLVIGTVVYWRGGELNFALMLSVVLIAGVVFSKYLPSFRAELRQT